MNCVDFETRIAAGEAPGQASWEANDADVAEHIKTCAACRSFANELAENASALRSIEVNLAAYTAVRARVMAALQPKRRFGWLWAAAATVIAACIALLWSTSPFPPPEPPRFQVVIHSIDPGSPVRRVAVKKKKPARKPVQLEAIKILTDDPNVVIIWLMDDKKGDSL